VERESECTRRRLTVTDERETASRGKLGNSEESILRIGLQDLASIDMGSTDTEHWQRGSKQRMATSVRSNVREGPWAGGVMGGSREVW
jgi:hypothetical protein